MSEVEVLKKQREDLRQALAKVLDVVDFHDAPFEGLRAKYGEVAARKIVYARRVFQDTRVVRSG